MTMRRQAPRGLRSPPGIAAAWLLGLATASLAAVPANPDTARAATTQAGSGPGPGAEVAAPGAAGTAAPSEQLDTSLSDKEPARIGRRRDYDDEDRPKRHHPHFKSDIWLPLPCLLLPGIGQYFQGDWTGAVYTGVAVGGLLLFEQAALELRDSAQQNQANLDPTAAPDSWSVRKMVLGAMAFQGSSFLSAYSTFRSSVPRFQEEDGKYRFLTAQESIGDMLLSPARFDHLAKPSSFIPLGILAGAAGYLALDYRSSQRGSDWTFSGDDVLFYWPLAYNAGVTEEALFRGWLLPVAYQYTGETWWLANGAQALLFGLAHYSSDNPYPWPQALLGYYFGYLTRKNGWSLSESIFVHSWWDAILFTAQFATMRRVHTGSTAFRFDLPLPF